MTSQVPGGTCSLPGRGSPPEGSSPPLSCPTQYPHVVTLMTLTTPQAQERSRPTALKEEAEHTEQECPLGTHIAPSSFQPVSGSPVKNKMYGRQSPSCLSLAPSSKHNPGKQEVPDKRQSPFFFFFTEGHRHNKTKSTIIRDEDD